MEYEIKDEGFEANFFTKWLEKGMRSSLNEMTTLKDIDSFVGTFNVNNKTLRDEISETLEAWLIREGAPAPDMYVLGFQEIVDLNTFNVVFDGHQTEARMAYWHERVVETLARIPGARYTCLREEKMVGIGLFVFAKSTLVEADAFSDVRSTIAPVGILGVLGNKGAVAIRLNIFDTSVCFVAAHMSSGKGQTESRNHDYFEILRKAIFKANGGLSIDHDSGHSSSASTLSHSRTHSGAMRPWR